MSEFRSTAEPRKGRISANTFQHREVLYSAIDEMAIFEGDIALGTVAEIEAVAARPEVMALAPQGIAIKGTQYRWPDRRVPYLMAPSFPGPERVLDAIRHWEEKTTLRFLALDGGNVNQHPDHILFISSDGCWSHVGRRGGEQEISLGPGCSTGNAIHEIGHAVGLWHEQSRGDRDRHVKILRQNIVAGMEHNFDQHVTDGDDVGPYDHDSIMHYPAEAFSRNGQPTIEVPSGAAIGQREGLSPGDIATIAQLYG